jgi:hypothetical protein
VGGEVFSAAQGKVSPGKGRFCGWPRGGRGAGGGEGGRRGGRKGRARGKSSAARGALPGADSRRLQGLHRGLQGAFGCQVNSRNGDYTAANELQSGLAPENKGLVHRQGRERSPLRRGRPTAAAKQPGQGLAGGGGKAAEQGVSPGLTGGRVGARRRSRGRGPALARDARGGGRGLRRCPRRETNQGCRSKARQRRFTGGGRGGEGLWKRAKHRGWSGGVVGGGLGRWRRGHRGSKCPPPSGGSRRRPENCGPGQRGPPSGENFPLAGESPPRGGTGRWPGPQFQWGSGGGEGRSCALTHRTLPLAGEAWAVEGGAPAPLSPGPGSSHPAAGGDSTGTSWTGGSAAPRRGGVWRRPGHSPAADSGSLPQRAGEIRSPLPQRLQPGQPLNPAPRPGSAAPEGATGPGDGRKGESGNGGESSPRPEKSGQKNTGGK